MTSSSSHAEQAYAQIAEGRGAVAFLMLPGDRETPLSVMRKLGDRPYLSLFESVSGGENRGRYSFITLSPDEFWYCDKGKAYGAKGEIKNSTALSGSPLVSLKQWIARSKMEIPSRLPPMSAGVFGYFGYDMIRLVEHLPSALPDEIGVPEAFLMRPQLVIIFDNARDEMILTSPIWVGVPCSEKQAKALYAQAMERIETLLSELDRAPSAPNYRSFLAREEKTQAQPITQPEECSSITRERYYEMVARAKEYIAAGDIFQVVPSQRFSMKFSHSPLSLYRALRRLNPSPFCFHLHIGSAVLVGASPEILVRVRDRKVTIRPIAGTRPRGKNAAEDSALAEDLRRDAKELAEHLMLLDLGRNDVGRVAAAASVKVTEKNIIEYYSHVMHLVSNVEGQLADDKDAIDALMAGFPAGTVSGAPKIRAMEIIDELESAMRSFYAGCVGYFSANGDMDTCITLRTALVKDHILYAQAGGGVVADSDPLLEYQESCNKARVIFTAAHLAGNYQE